jgi:CheY-like chemotaxis protein
VARVLIVEDKPTDRVIMANIIERTGHEVCFAYGGKEALGICLRGGIDIVVTDLQMPDGDGLELIEALRALLPEPVIITGSGSGPELHAEAESKGTVTALSKPIELTEFVETLAQATQDRPAPPEEMAAPC